MAAILCIITVKAQEPKATITGKITWNGTNIAAATVSLLKASDSALVKIAVSNQAGIYTFEQIPFGNYFIKAEAIGYETNVTNLLIVTKKITQVNDIVLQPQTQNLSDVVVTTRRPLVETKLDKTVINVDASPTNTGLSALEVLEKSPGVTVDNDGKISLKGKAGIIVLIDGKPTYLNAQELANYLKNIPATQLDQIEIMTQPSAKYDASGNSGVINIKTKKTKTAGFNANLTLTPIFGKYFKTSNSINANWRKGKINLFGNYGFSLWRNFNKQNFNTQLYESKDLPANRYVNQHIYSTFSSPSHNFKFGGDYFASSKTTLGFVINGYFETETDKNHSVSNFYDSLQRFVQYNLAEGKDNGKWNNMSFNANFQHKLDTSGSEITADADYVFYKTQYNPYLENYLTNADSTPSEAPYFQRGHLPSNINIYTLKADYTHPFKKNAGIEAGFKISYVKTDNNAQYSLYNQSIQKWQNDTMRSNYFIYKENINAAYVNLKKQYKKWSFQAGLRAEQTVSKGNQITRNISFDKNYLQWFPTGYVGYKLSDKHNFSVSYGRRIERPSYNDLNPFQYQADRYTYEQGNPNLQPQYSHNIELSYNYKNQLTLTTSYTAYNNLMNPIVINKKLPNDSNYTLFQTTENIASSNNLGFSVSYNKQITKWWTLNLFGNVYRNEFKGIAGTEYVHRNLASFNTNMSSQFSFQKGWSAEVSGWMSTKQLFGSSLIVKPFGFFSIGGGKKILKEKGNLKVNIRDPFALMSFRGTVLSAKGITEIHNTWDNRRFIVTFTYRFGKGTGNGSTQRRKASEEEESRMKSKSGS